MLLPGKKAMQTKATAMRTIYFINPYTFFVNRKQLKNMMSRHENVNQRIKTFQIMRQMFRHRWKKHNLSFSAVVKLVQLKLQNGEPLAVVSLL